MTITLKANAAARYMANLTKRGTRFDTFRFGDSITITIRM